MTKCYYTPSDRLKKHIFDSYPPCRTEHNVTDEMELLAIAREYKDEAPNGMDTY